MSVMASHGETNPGRKRRRNEDAFVCEPPLFAVADGMGGAQAGEVASSLAAAALSGALADRDGVAASDAEQIVAGLIQEANTLVHERATHDATASGMGTTMTVALVAGDERVTIGHVGDSRAYLLRDGSLEQLTDDHSLVAELVRRGELSAAEAQVHPQRSVITRALGTDPEVEIDVFSIEGRDRDLFLLCSDGLSTMVDADTMAEIVGRGRGDLAAATRELIRAANESGGDDNITAVLFELSSTRDLETLAGGDPEERGTEARAPEDEDTLHPEDGIPVIAFPAEPTPDEDAPTAVGEPPEPTPEDEVTVTTVAAAPPEEAPTFTEPAEPAIAESLPVVTDPPGDEAVPEAAEATEPTAEADDRVAADTGEQTEEVAEADATPDTSPPGAEESVRAALAAAEPEPTRIPVGRLIASTLVIIVLATLIVVLALWGLAR
jgi:serine/threonine protein phosphatase PrpC